PEDRHPNAGLLYEELVQFLYSSGRRAGGHDLADFLAELRQAGEIADQTPDDARLRAVFAHEQATPGAYTPGAYTPDATPIEVPVARAAGRTSGGPPRSGGWVARPTRERRDVTVLVVRSDGACLRRDPLVDRALRRYGATATSDEPPPGGAPA